MDTACSAIDTGPSPWAVRALTNWPHCSRHALDGERRAAIVDHAASCHGTAVIIAIVATIAPSYRCPSLPSSCRISVQRHIPRDVAEKDGSPAEIFRAGFRREIGGILAGPAH
ncbi:MAG: hypothetical protein E6J90_48335 [Deltaproteobacteria bacterium]|nr:MAG: hypothetical protein E6J90_48335 [Deltaproteobacteria bacterium]